MTEHYKWVLNIERSPSARKVWIEISGPERKYLYEIVAFRKEGVD